MPVAVSFTVEQDGRLPDGTPLRRGITEVDAEGGPDYFMVNCAHPTHIAGATEDERWRSRIVGLRANASTRSHAELDAATELDEGDPAELAKRKATAAVTPAEPVVAGRMLRHRRPPRRPMWLSDEPLVTTYDRS